MKYNNIRHEVYNDTGARFDEIKALIESSDLNNVHSELYRWSTQHSCDQFVSGSISQETFTARAVKRLDKAFMKDVRKRCDLLETAADATPVEVFDLDLVHKGNGYNARLVTQDADGQRRVIEGACKGGYGYDKASTAAAEVLNQAPGILQKMYACKEKALEEGVSDKKGNSVRDNRGVIHYGAGYGAVPYFEHSVGINTTCAVLETIGYNVRVHYSDNAIYILAYTSKDALLK